HGVVTLGWPIGHLQRASTPASGLMTFLDCSLARDSTSRHSLICCHQSASSVASVLRRACANSWLNSVNTCLTEPTMGTSTGTRLEMDEGSISIWTILRGCWAKCCGLLITRSSNRAPTEINTSQYCMAILAS